MLCKVETYEELYTEVKKLNNTKILQKWLQVDFRPFKHTLLNIVQKWSCMFKQNLSDGVTKRYCLAQYN